MGMMGLFKNKIIVRSFSSLVQYILPQHFLSRLLGAIMQIKTPWLKNALIRWFIKKYDIQTQDAISDKLEDYQHFNAFFTRALKPDLRHMSTASLISPVDGTIAQSGSIESGTNAKGCMIQAAPLLGLRKAHLSQATLEHVNIYLSPRDYHRFHMPIDGTITAMRYIPGRLFSVNQKTSAEIPNLFSRNERVVLTIQSGDKTLYMVMVGALLVASIYLHFHGLVRPKNINQAHSWHFPEGLDYKKGEDLGYFQFGSTVILVCDEKDFTLLPQQENTSITLGTALSKK